MPDQKSLLAGIIEEDEFGRFYAGYIQKSGGRNLFLRLEEGRNELRIIMSSLDDEAALYRYREGKWSIKEVLGHMTDTERIMGYRALSFARGDSAELPGFDQDHYVDQANFDGWPLSDLMNNYESVRASTLALFRSFTDDMLLRKGVASKQPFSVRAVGFVIAGHELHHLDILREMYLPEIHR
ncbi:MAG: DinB family protein [Balneolaceae bacterium]